MKQEWCLLYEKFSDGQLTDEEQRQILDLSETSEEFRLFWQEASGQYSLLAVLEPSTELKSFLSSALFLDSKIKKARERKGKGKILRLAVITAAALIPVAFFLLNKTLPDVAYSANQTLSKWSYLNRQVSLGKEETVLLRKGKVEYSIQGPAVFSFDFKGQLHLSEGEVHINTYSAGDAKVITPGGSYNDIGTSFGLSVNYGSEEVHVFDGAVEASYSGKINEGEALKTENGNISDLDINRGKFVSFSQFEKKIDDKAKYIELRRKLLEDSEVTDIFDLTNSEDYSGNISGLKNSSIKLSFESVSQSIGPFPGTKSVSFINNGAVAKLELPKEMKNYSIILKYYHREYENRSISILSSSEKDIVFSQPMKWFKDNYGKKGFLDERFWVYRYHLIQLKDKEVFISNLVDVTQRKSLQNNSSNIFYIGNRKEQGVDFTGDLASIIIMDQPKMNKLKELFDNRHNPAKTAR